MHIQKTSVAIIGAGIAGLRTAIELKRHGIQYIVIEKQTIPGGRIKTISSNGFLLDSGFQVLLDSYDELPSALNLSNLRLNSFDSGANVTSNGTEMSLFNPIKHPEKVISTLISHPGNLLDLVKLVILAIRANAKSPDFFTEKSRSTADLLQQFGFSNAFIDGFFRPFFGGVFLDSQLKVPANYFLWLLDKFRSGNATLPEKGMGEIGNQMALQAGPILYNEQVTDLKDNLILFESGKQFEADWIINATGMEDVVAPKQKTNAANFRGTSTYYFSSDFVAHLPKSIVLIADPKSFILHFCFPSAIQKSYAPKGKSLCSVTLNWHGPSENPTEMATKIIEELLIQYTSVNWNAFSFLAHFDIPFALPKWETGNEKTYIVEGNRLTIGDHVSYPSINGALRSGREAAQFLIAEIENQKVS